MRVFYWTEPWGTTGRRFYQADSKDNFAAEVATHGVTKEAVIEMIDAGYQEISPTTAQILGLPT